MIPINLDGTCIGCGVLVDMTTQTCVNPSCFFGPNTTQPMGAPAATRTFGTKADPEELAIKAFGHRWLENKKGRSECVDCGLVSLGFVKSPDGQDIGSWLHRGVTFLQNKPPACDPGAKR